MGGAHGCDFASPGPKPRRLAPERPVAANAHASGAAPEKGCTRAPRTVPIFALSLT